MATRAVILQMLLFVILHALFGQVASCASELDRAYEHLYERMDVYAQHGVRLIESYMVPYPPLQQDVAFTYDNAHAILALLARGTAEDTTRARTLCESLLYCQQHDPDFDDGRLRDGYSASSLIGIGGKVWVKESGCGCGNMAWTIIAWLEYRASSGEPDPAFRGNLLLAAESLGDFIEKHFRDNVGCPGYIAGYNGWGQNVMKYKVTEHNLTVYAAFMRLYAATGDPTWLDRSNNARAFVSQVVWDPSGQMFRVGTTDTDLCTLNAQPLQQAEDANSWGALVLRDIARYGGAITWLENNCALCCEESGAGQPPPVLCGFDFNTDKDGIWLEGTAHMALVYKTAGREAKAEYYLAQLRKAQAEHPEGNGKGIVASCHYRVTTGFDGWYYPSVHVGATAWYALAESGFNPFWGRADVQNTGQAKTVSDGNLLLLSGKKVTAVFAGFFYAEEPNRSAGVRVCSDQAVAEGDDVSVIGIVRTTDGEKEIVASRVSATQASGLLSPLGMANRTLGGGALGLQQGVKDGTGLNNIGLLIRTWGRVTEIGSDCFYLSDGGTVPDDMGHEGVKVLAPGLEPQKLGSSVQVTGISSCFKVGDNLYPMIRVRNQQDILVTRKVVYAEDFASGAPSWTASDGGFYWDSVRQAYHSALADCGNDSAFVPVTYSGGSFQLEFDWCPVQTAPYATHRFGLWDSGMNCGSFVGAFMEARKRGEPDPLLAGLKLPSGCTYVPDPNNRRYPIDPNVPYHGIITYSNGTTPMVMFTLKRMEYKMIMATSEKFYLTGAYDFGSANRLAMSSIGDADSPGATAEAYWDNILLTVPGP